MIRSMDLDTAAASPPDAATGIAQEVRTAIADARREECERLEQESLKRKQAEEWKHYCALRDSKMEGLVGHDNAMEVFTEGNYLSDGRPDPAPRRCARR